MHFYVPFARLRFHQNIILVRCFMVFSQLLNASGFHHHLCFCVGIYSWRRHFRWMRGTQSVGMTKTWDKHFGWFDSHECTIGVGVMSNRVVCFRLGVECISFLNTNWKSHGNDCFCEDVLVGPNIFKQMPEIEIEYIVLMSFAFFELNCRSVCFSLHFFASRYDKAYCLLFPTAFRALDVPSLDGNRCRQFRRGNSACLREMTIENTEGCQHEGAL